jgi:hypothetical protein
MMSEVALMLACGRITDTTPPAVVTGLRGPWAADSTWFEVKKRAGRRGVRVMANRVDGEESVVERENQSGDLRVKSSQVCVGFGVKKVPLKGVVEIEESVVDSAAAREWRQTSRGYRQQGGLDGEEGVIEMYLGRRKAQGHVESCPKKSSGSFLTPVKHSHSRTAFARKHWCLHAQSVDRGWGLDGRFA